MAELGFAVDVPLPLPTITIDCKAEGALDGLIADEPHPFATLHVAPGNDVKHVHVIRNIPYDPSHPKCKYRQYDLYMPDLEVPVPGSCLPCQQRRKSSSAASPMLDEKVGPDSTGAASRGMRPVIVFVPGGGWRQHGRFAPLNLYVSLGRSFARRGYIVVITSYRLRGALFLQMLPLYLLLAFFASAIITPAVAVTFGATLVPLLCGLLVPFAAIVWWHWFGWIVNHTRVHHPGQLDDTARAISHIKASIARYAGDADTMFVSGQSAGAHIVSMLALHPEYFDKYGLPGGLSAANNFKGLVILSPVLAPVSWLGTNVLSDAAEERRRRGCCHLIQDSMLTLGYPPFQTLLGNAKAFNQSFPLRAAYDLGNVGIRSLNLPPIFLMTTAGEYGIDTGVNACALLLHNSGVQVHRYHILQADHGSYMFDMDQPQKPGERVVASLIASFLLQCITTRVGEPAGVRGGGTNATLRPSSGLSKTVIVPQDIQVVVEQ